MDMPATFLPLLRSMVVRGLLFAALWWVLAGGDAWGFGAPGIAAGGGGSPARTLLVNTMSLLPGTLSAGIEGNRLRLHVLDTQLPVEQELGEVETRIAAMFGVE